MRDTRTPAMQEYTELCRQYAKIDKQRRELHTQIWKDSGAFTHPHKPTRKRIQNRIEDTLRAIECDAFDEAHELRMYAPRLEEAV